MFRFDNSLLRELPGEDAMTRGTRQVDAAVYSRVDPVIVRDPHLLSVSAPLMQELGLDLNELDAVEFARIFSGNQRMPGSETYATNYGGHQFGHWAGQLGDGRAILLGEVINPHGVRYELQLKGAGPTPYSRQGDGLAVMRSSIREYVCSEAMHALGVPTTRALSLVSTGEQVLRDVLYDGHPAYEQGAVVCRVAPSFIRFGHFELPYARGDIELLRQLAEFCIWRDFPELIAEHARNDFKQAHTQGIFTQAVYAEWFKHVCERTAYLMSEWMRVGFVHGVMNTDNMSILGLTIDYGPYGWIEPFDPDWTPNTTDKHGKRYRFGWQAKIAQWNLTQLAQALSPLFDSVEPLQAGIEHYIAHFQASQRVMVANKLGLDHADDEDIALMNDVYALMASARIDMTIWFRQLIELDSEHPAIDVVAPAFYSEALMQDHASKITNWLHRYAQRIKRNAMSAQQRIEHMQQANPLYVPRNYLAQEVIDQVEAGDTGAVDEWMQVLRQPYLVQPGKEHFAQKRPEWAETRVGCAMLSCSS